MFIGLNCFLMWAIWPMGLCVCWFELFSQVINLAHVPFVICNQLFSDHVINSIDNSTAKSWVWHVKEPSLLNGMERLDCLIMTLYNITMCFCHYVLRFCRYVGCFRHYVTCFCHYVVCSCHYFWCVFVVMMDAFAIMWGDFVFMWCAFVFMWCVFVIMWDDLVVMWDAWLLYDVTLLYWRHLFRVSKNRRREETLNYINGVMFKFVLSKWFYS